VERMKKGRKKGRKKECSSPGKKESSKVNCLRGHHMGHYARKCLEKKKGNTKHVVTCTVVGVNEGSS